MIATDHMNLEIAISKASLALLALLCTNIFDYFAFTASATKQLKNQAIKVREQTIPKCAP